MNKKLYSFISLLMLIAGAIIAVYVLLDIYFLSRNTPAGSCPFTTDRPLIYIALALCIGSFLFSCFEKKTKK